MPQDARLDGGDVLKVGDQIFIGLSTRTNAAGVAFFEQVCAPLQVSVHAINVPSGLHLKSAVSLFDEKTLLAAHSEAGRQLAGEISKLANLRVIYVPDAVCCNVLRIGSHLVIQKGFPQSEAILEKLATELGLTGALAVDSWRRFLTQLMLNFDFVSHPPPQSSSSKCPKRSRPMVHSRAAASCFKRE